QFLPERSSKWFKVESALALPLFLPGSKHNIKIGLQFLRVQFVVFVNVQDPKAKGLLISDELTVTSSFKGNAGLRLSDKLRDSTDMSHCTLRACKPIFMAKQCIDL
ncbi:hypothetical protein TSAR_004830, partial [Trichomalopsis sarcophagae]